LPANQGSEGGTIVVDEEHEADANIWLERDTNVVPAALTCDAYGRMQMRTRYFASLDAARREFEAMKADLADIVSRARPRRGAIRARSQPHCGSSQQESSSACDSAQFRNSLNVGSAIERRILCRQG
jgi:hypothetical protein